MWKADVKNSSPMTVDGASRMSCSVSVTSEGGSREAGEVSMLSTTA